MPTTDDVHLDSLKPAAVLRVRLTAPAQRMADAVRSTLESLLTVAEDASMRCAGPPEVAVLGHHLPCTQAEVRIPVVGVPTGGLLSCFAYRPGGTVARTFHDTGLDDLEPARATLLTWMADHGYHAAGQLTLYHLCVPKGNLEPAEHLAAVAIPVHADSGEDCSVPPSAPSNRTARRARTGALTGPAHSTSARRHGDERPWGR